MVQVILQKQYQKDTLMDYFLDPTWLHLGIYSPLWGVQQKIIFIYLEQKTDSVELHLSLVPLKNSQS